MKSIDITLSSGSQVAGRRNETPDKTPPVRRCVIPSALSGVHVLLVDDDLVGQELTGELLRSAGMRVTVAEDGADALAWLAAEPFDIVLMDCQMPVMDGYEATRALRLEPRLRRLPVLAMTGNSMPGDRERALEAGMDDQIGKPIDVALMFETLVRWLPCPSTEPSIESLASSARPSARASA